MLSAIRRQIVVETKILGIQRICQQNVCQRKRFQQQQRSQPPMQPPIQPQRPQPLRVQAREPMHELSFHQSAVSSWFASLLYLALPTSTVAPIASVCHVSSNPCCTPPVQVI